MIIYTIFNSHENIQEVRLILHGKKNLVSTYQNANYVLNIEQCTHQ